MKDIEADMEFAANYAETSQVGKAIDDGLVISVEYLMDHTSSAGCC